MSDDQPYSTPAAYDLDMETDTGLNSQPGLNRILSRKHADAMSCARSFLARLLALPLDQVTATDDPAERHTRGNVRLPDAGSAHVVYQQIDPDRYPMTHVAVAELAFHPRNPATTALLAQQLDIPTDILSHATVRDFRPDGADTTFGNPEHLTVLITPTLNSPVTFYVNPDSGHIYAYETSELLGRIKNTISTKGLRRGYRAGENVLSVLVPVPKWRYSRDRNGLWRYVGTGMPEAEKQKLRDALTAKK